jgi:hypothetical protein
MLLPDQHLGVYVSYNSLGARDGGLVDQHIGFQRAFFDYYYPAPAVTPMQPQADFIERAGRFTGFYRDANSHSTTPERAQYLFGSLEIRDAGDGTLAVPMGEGIKLRFVEVEPLYFRQVDGPYSMLFREDDQGNIVYMFTDIIPQWGFRKLDWYETPGFNMLLALVCVLVFLSMLPVALIRALRNRRTGGEQSSAARAANWINVGICVLNLLFIVGIALWFRPMHPSELHDIPQIVEVVMGLGVLAAVLTIGALISTALAWKNRYWGVAYRVYYTLVTVAAVAFVWFLHYWNWLGWRY